MFVCRLPESEKDGADGVVNSKECYSDSDD